MNLRLKWVVTLMLCLATWAAAESQAVSDDEKSARAAVAERLCQMAQTNFGNKAINLATLQQSAALLESASRLNPAEPRFLRLLIEAYLQLGGQQGRAGARSALERYRQLSPNDQSAQVRLIDLNLAEMDSADQQSNYVKKLLDVKELTDEVKSHVAVVGARLAIERASTEAADAMLNRALELFPLSPEALKLKYERLPLDAAPPERAALLLQMLRSNPTQPGAMIELAQLLADEGLVDASLNWYQTALGTAQRLSLPAVPEQLTAYAAELVIADQLRSAEPLLGKILESDPSNSDAAFLLLIVTKRIGDADKITTVTEKCRATMMAKLGRVSDAAHGRETAADAVPTPSVTDDIKKLKELNNPGLSDAYASGLADLAWVELYCNSSADAAAPHIAALRELVPGDSPTLARLEGWTFLVQGKKDEAKVKLSAVAEADPLAGLGMIRLGADSMAADQLREECRKLLNQNASGVVGALLLEAMRDKFGLMPAGTHAAAVRAELDKFPRAWLDILDFQKSREFYSIKAAPMKVGHAFGEPMIATVTITNTSSYDITIGPEGAIRPDLWFDVQLKGLVQQYIGGIAFDRLGQRLVLHPKQSASQTVRVDQGRLAGLLSSNPTMQVPLYFSVLTNPMTQQGGIVPGPGGYRAQFTRVVERSPTPPNAQAIQKAIATLNNGNGEARISTLILLATFSKALSMQDDDAMKRQAAELADVIRKSTGDTSPMVAALATYLTGMLSPKETQQGVIHSLLESPEPAARVPGLMAAQDSIEPEARKALAGALAEKDTDELVKKLAQTVVKVADLPPTTQPAAPEPGDGAATAGPG